MQQETFQIETILTIITGYGFERGLSNAKALVGFMTGEPANELTFLARTRPDICKEELLRQYPDLEEFVSLEVNCDNYQEILEAAFLKVGRSLTINAIENMPTPQEYFASIDQTQSSR